MQILLDEISNYLNRDSKYKDNEVFILQGRLISLGIKEEEIGFLFNELYEKGVIGILQKDWFDYEDNTKETVDDFMYRFRAKKLRLEEYERELLGKLQNQNVEFDDTRGIIKYLGKEIPLTPGTNEKYVCKCLFEYKPGFAVGWEACYETIQGSEPNGVEKEKRMVYDSVRRINKHFKEDFPQIDLFLIKNNFITRTI